MADTKPAAPKQAPATKKPVETKDVRFKRLARTRLPRALQRIKALENLGNKNQYTYTPEQAAYILTALRDAVDACGRAYSGKAAQTALPSMFQ